MTRSRIGRLREQIRRAILDSSGKDVPFRRGEEFADLVHRCQIRHNPVFRRWVARNPRDGLPIMAFKQTAVRSFRSSGRHPWFESSGTTGRGQETVSRHDLRSLDLYEASVVSGWRWFLAQRKSERRSLPLLRPNFVGVMPSFRERPHSSLSCMVDLLMKHCGDGRGFWCMRSEKWDWRGFHRHLRDLEKRKRASVLFGTAFGWVHFLDWCSDRRLRFHLPSDTLVLETGGYKGRSRELRRPILHRRLRRLLGLSLDSIRSEYSMCELSSQAYSFTKMGKDGICRTLFRFPPWCRHRIVRPGTSLPARRGHRGVLEIRDLANLDSCAFLRTEDIAVERGDGFELEGRLPRAGLKGCSLSHEHEEKPLRIQN